MTYNKCICHIIMTIFSRLPTEIINFHIIPYTYHLNSPELLLDIRSYSFDYSLVTSIYYTQYNEFILLNDLETFVCSIDEDIQRLKLKIPKVFSRNKHYKEVEHNIFIDKFKNTCRKNRMIWGLLTLYERTRFINYFIIDDLDE